MRSRQKSEKLGSKIPGSIPRGKLQKIIDLGKRKPTNFYIVNTQGINKQDGIFRLRLTDKDATLSESIITYKDRGGARKTLRLSMVRDDHYHFFTNYWLAWAFAQRVIKGKPND